MKKTAYITVIGTLPTPARFDLDETRLLGEVIASGNSNKSTNFNYAAVNNEAQLQDMVQSPNFVGTRIVCAEKLFKKYIFFDGLTCLPNLPGFTSFDVDADNCSSQFLALQLALYIKLDTVFLLGYDISKTKELELLKSTMRSNPNTKFVYVCNPPRTNQLDDLPNGSCMFYAKLQELIDANKQ